MRTAVSHCVVLVVALASACSARPVVDWSISLLARDARPDTAYDVHVRDRCGGTETYASWVVQGEAGARDLDVPVSRAVIEVEALDARCVAYAAGCAEVTGTQAVRVSLEPLADPIDRCLEGTCPEMSRCDPLDAGVPPDGGAPRDADPMRPDVPPDTGPPCDPDCAMGCDGSRCLGARSCAPILRQDPSAPDGVHEIDPDGAGGDPPFDAYCAGGWTLVAKIDGARSTFEYDAPLWTDTSTLSPSSLDTSTTEAKLEAFLSVPFAEVRVDFRSASGEGRIDLPLSAPSMRALFAGPPIDTDRGRAAWIAAIPGARVQAMCNAEGVNVIADPSAAGSAAVRLGLLGNNETNCFSADSALGIGIRILRYCVVGEYEGAAGSVAWCELAGMEGGVPAFAWVWVR